MPTDEQSKSMLYAALKLRLSLVGSMLATICSNEATTLDWTTLLMQLICSGAVDRQTDSRCVCLNVCVCLCVCACACVHACTCACACAICMLYFDFLSLLLLLILQ